MIEAAFRGPVGQFALDASFTVPGRGVTALFGPSGCGKTSVLRAVAGLIRLPGSRCIVGGEVWQDGATFLPTHRRPIGYVFQEPSLFPHLSVKRNLLYAAPSGPPGPHPGFEQVVGLLRLSALLERSSRTLSGGERQRVAIGRALLSRPALLLMDEPLAALDAEAKAEIIPLLETMQTALGLPMLYVSHDLREVERLAETVVLMQAGKVVAQGPLGALQTDLASPLARAYRADVTLAAVVEAVDPAYATATLAVDGGRFLASADGSRPGDRRRLRVHAADVALAREAPAATTIANCLPAVIVAAAPGGPADMTAVLALGAGGTGAKLLSRVTRRSWDHLGLSVGAGVYALVKAVAVEAEPRGPG